MPPWICPSHSSGFSIVPDIIDRAVAGQRDLAGFGVDLDLADMRAGREGRGVGRPEIASAR